MALDENDLIRLAEEIVSRLKKELGVKPRDKWIDDIEAMRLLGITSKTTLQKMRNEGKIRFSQPEKKIILYDTDSIDAYLESHARNTLKK